MLISRTVKWYYLEMIFFVVCVVVAIISMFIFLKSFSKTKREFDTYISNLAASRGWLRSTAAPLLPLLEQQAYRSGSTILEGALDDRQFWLYESEPTKQLNNSNTQLQTVTLLSVSFPQQFPDLLIMPAHGIMAAAYDAMAQSMFNLIPLELEGDFSQYVRVYVKKGEEIDVLTYLSPDVMAAIQDHIKSFVIFSGNYMSVSAYMPLTPASLDAMMSDTSLLLKEIRQKSFEVSS